MAVAKMEALRPVGETFCGAKPAKNDERPGTIRLQDARAALPQNCSSTTLIVWSLSAYGTSVPRLPGKCYMGNSVEKQTVGRPLPYWGCNQTA